MSVCRLAGLWLCLLIGSPASTAERPNILLILADDLGYSDLGCFGSAIPTPHLDQLAKEGLRYTQFYNCGRCCPTRASLLTGMYPHQAGVGHMMQPMKAPAYTDGLNNRCATIAEMLSSAGYRNYLVGKWHTGTFQKSKSHTHSNHPLDRGFHNYYGTGGGANYFKPLQLYRERAKEPFGEDYYFTEALGQETVKYLQQHARDHTNAPFFIHLCFTAPHFPLHARPEAIARFRNKFQHGWDQERKQRFEKLVQMGIVPPGTQLPARHPNVPAWDTLKEEEKQNWDLRMAIFAAMIESMDQQIGKVLAELRQQNKLDNTLILFLSDNGSSAEKLDTWPNPARGHKPGSSPGSTDSHLCLEVGWANASNTPFREHKMWMHEGGICTPLILRYGDKVAQPGSLRHTPAHIIDLLPTFLDLAEISPLKQLREQTLIPIEGVSLKPTLNNQPIADRFIYWEHEGNKAIRYGAWKAVAEFQKPWELYNLQEDRTETKNRMETEKARGEEMVTQWQSWAKRIHVEPWENLPASKYTPSAGYQKRGEAIPADSNKNNQKD